MVSIILALLLVLGIAVVLRARLARPRLRRRAVQVKATSHPFAPKKPDWARREVVRLKAMMPEEGCRTIACAFNPMNDRKGYTVGKTYVAQTLKRHAAEILLVRRKMRKRPRKPGRPNLTWALDLTFVPGNDRPVLGVLDHGSRGLLLLRELHDRSTIGVLRLVLDLIERFGRPRFLRTDNEKIFTSRLLRFALAFLGVRHQRIDPFCPWQNGRIERVFRTLKERLRLYWERAGRPDDVQPDLDTLRAWYNHARPHQSLEGLTPATAWSGAAESRKAPRFFSAWDGVLTGWVAPSS